MANRDDFQKEARTLVVEITQLFATRYPTGAKDYEFQILSGLATVAANILSDINDQAITDSFTKQVQATTKDFVGRKASGEGPDAIVESPKIN